MSVVIIIFTASLVLVMLYLLAICPGFGKKREFTGFEQVFYAHRGLHDNNSEDAPENSYHAFELAIQENYGIELDVQITKDNIPVVFHDQTLKRVCGDEKRVCDYTYEELNAFRLFQTQERIPRFDDVMNLIHGQVPVIVEIKMYDDHSRVNEIAMQVLDSYEGVYCMESFNPKSLMWFKKNRPQVLRGQLSANFIRGKEPGNKLKYFAWQNLLFNFRTRPDFIAYNCKEKDMLSVVLCRKLYKEKMFAWTIRSRELYLFSKDSFDYFIFDSVDPKTF